MRRQMHGKNFTAMNINTDRPVRQSFDLLWSERKQ